MSEDIENKMNQIKALFGNDNNTSNGLKNILNNLGDQNQPQNSQESPNNKTIDSGMPDTFKNLFSLLGNQNNQSQEEQSRSNGNDSGMPLDPDMIQMFFKFKQVLDVTRSNNDPRENLLLALKPYLSNKRQSRVGECLTILKLSKILGVLTKSEGGEGNAKPK